MRPREPFAEKALRHQRQACLLGAALIGACYPIDLVQPRTAAAMALRTAWIAAVLFAAWAQQADRPRLARAGAHLGGAASGAAAVAIIAVSGGTASLYEGMFLAIPFAVLVGFPELPSAAALAGGIGVLGGLAVRWSEGQRPVDLLGWLLLSTVMAALAVFGTAMTRRLFRDELAAAHDRALAAEALADSERRRAEAEELAETGRVAAGVVHEMSSPLAALRTNLRTLARGEVEEGERDEVLADAVEGVERITGVVAALGRSIHPLEPRRSRG